MANTTFDMKGLRSLLDVQYGDAIELPAPPHSPSPSAASRRSRSARQEREEKYIAIGIDFGTTYSGVSWAHSSTPNDIHHVAHWPYDGKRGKDEVQIPTQVDFATQDWGYLISKDADPIRWFKLLLLEPRDLKRDMKDTSVPLEDARTKLRAHAGFEEGAVVDLIANFLKKLWDHAMEEIAYEMDLDLLPIKVAITVPAIWPLYARQKMETAAKKAGILNPRRIGETTLILVEEPEAAAVSTLFDRKEYPEIEVGECFIVCDCGGGTIDITSYVVKSVSPFLVEEAVPGGGKLCGAFLIDDAFENWMNIKSGLKFDKCDPADVRGFINDEWEHGIKRNFTGKEQFFHIRPPAKAFGVMKRTKGATDHFQISSDIIKQFFARTYSGIRELISEQKTQIERAYGKQPKKILLVGGLGSSRYLYSMLQAQHQNPNERERTVLQPAHAWSSVSRGACLAILRKAYNPAGASLGKSNAANRVLRSMPQVSSRKARESYGAIFGYPVHSVSPPVNLAKETPYIDKEGTKRVHRVEWYLRKGETVQDRDPVVHHFFNTFSGPHDKMVKLMIRVSDADIPSPWPNDGVRDLCEIACEVDVPWDKMGEMRDPKGKLLDCRKVDDLALSMSFGGAPKWTLKAGGHVAEQKADVKYS